MTVSVTPSSPSEPAGTQPAGTPSAQPLDGGQPGAGSYQDPYPYPPQGAQAPPAYPGPGGAYPPPGYGYQQAVPPQQVPYGAPYAPHPQGKSKIAAGLLGIFFGSLGVHNFYLGRKGRAAGQLGLTCGSVGVIIIPFVLSFLMLSSSPSSASVTAKTPCS